MKEWPRINLDKMNIGDAIFNVGPRLRRALDERAIEGYRRGEYDFHKLARLLSLPVKSVKGFLVEYEAERGLVPANKRKEP